MAEEMIRLPIRSALIPLFYQKFHCLAQGCRDSCCVNWNITFNKKDYLRLRRLDAPPALKERLEQGVRRTKKGAPGGVFYGEFDLKSNKGRCPFLDEDSLCAIQRACGHDALPDVCTGYPRKISYTPAAREYALSPSCEGVLALLWDMPDGVDFVEDPLPKAEWRNVNVSRKDSLLPYFAPLRGLFVDVLQNRKMPLTERMLCLGVLIQRLQKEDWERLDLDSWIRQAALLADSGILKETEIPGNRDMFLMQNLNVLDAVQSAEKAWRAEIYSALEVKQKLVLPVISGASDNAGQPVSTAVNFSTRAYADALERFREAFSDHEYFFENLMVAVTLYLGFPRLGDREALWKSYVSLCNIYSFFRFVSVLGCRSEPEREKLFHMIVMASRATLHNKQRLDGFQEQLFRHDSSTLAHMAILLRWD